MQTYGWDLVAVTGCDQLNAALAAHDDDLPHDIVASFPDGSADIAGRIGNWQITQGGGQKFLHVALPLETGTLTVHQGGTRTVDVTGTTVILRVPLSLVERTVEETSLALRFDMHSAGELPDDVVPIGVLDPRERLSPQDRAAFTWLVAYFLVSHPELIKFVLATVMLEPSPTNPWLTPRQCAYTFVHLPVSDRDYLALLAVTTDRPIAQLERSVDSRLLPDTAVGQAIAVSADLFLTNVVLPVLPTAVGTGRYALDATTSTLRNQTEVAMPPTKVGAITYFPVGEEVRVTTTGNGLRAFVRGRCDLYGGIVLTFDVTANYPTDFDPVTKLLSFRRDANPTINYRADIPFYYWLLGPIAGSITELVVKLIADGLAGELNRLAGQALSIARTPPHSVRWADSGALDVRMAGIDGALYLRGVAPAKPPVALPPRLVGAAAAPDRRRAHGQRERGRPDQQALTTVK